MENDSKVTSLSKPLFAIFVILLALVLGAGGIIALILSLFFGEHYYFESLVMMGLGFTMAVVIFNVVLFSKSIEQTAKLVEEIDRSIAIQGMISKLNASHAQSAQVISINVRRVEGERTLQQMSDEELEEELNKSISEEDYERAVQIRAEKVRRKK